METSDKALPARKPAWLKVRFSGGPNYQQVRQAVSSNALHTVCESARCPNQGECWERGTATFMILGDVCTRSCSFCAVKTGRPPLLDLQEPARVAAAVKAMGLRYAVITSVNRDELPDGGAQVWAETVRAVRRESPATRIELLVPDFLGDLKAVDAVLEARPDVFGHNLETVPSLYRAVRPQARYERSLKVLAHAASRGFLAKSSLMLGLGEPEAELLQVFKDLRQAGVRILALGQYLQPAPENLAVRDYVSPERFKALKEQALSLGFEFVFSGPLVRSSYHAEEATQAPLLGKG
jgi:lipoic acid synthetase